MSAAVGAISSIAIVRLSAMGDVVMALPALEALRAAHPSAHVAWIVERRARNLLEGHPALDEIIDYPKPEWRSKARGIRGRAAATSAAFAWYRALRRRRFDATIDFQGNLKSASCSFFARARIRVGYAPDECREPNWLATNLRLSLGGQAVHRVDRDLLLAGRLGAAFRFVRPRIDFGVEDRVAGDACLPRAPGRAPCAVLHPGTSDFMPHKRWPLEAYAALADGLVRRAGARVLISWGPGEEATVDAILRAMSEKAEPLPKTPSMKSLGYLLGLKRG